MQSNWAAEHLQVIRTLMERSAIYRRALAPIMLFLGILGLIAALLARWLRFDSGIFFGWFWMVVSAVGVSGAYLMIRRQALKAAEPFWSPPTRRVTQAVMPSLTAGLGAGVLLILLSRGDPSVIRWLPPIWMVFYGCAVHAAGFFMPRGMKLFGWGFLCSGAAVAAWLAQSVAAPSARGGHAVMGLFFGGLHLAYGIYLYFTEKRKNEA